LERRDRLRHDSSPALPANRSLDPWWKNLVKTWVTAGGSRILDPHDPSVAFSAFRPVSDNNLLLGTSGRRRWRNLGSTDLLLGLLPKCDPCGRFSLRAWTLRFKRSYPERGVKAWVVR